MTEHADDGFAAFLDALWANPPIPHDKTIPEQREALDNLASIAHVDAEIVEVDAGGRQADVVTSLDVDPATDSRILYLHGGGYAIGSRISHRTHAALFSSAASARVVLLDYRLAPEHPFPTGLEDAVAAYRWMLGQGIAPASIAVAGDSAGGGLTIATLLALRDRDLPLPAAGVCLSPWTDLTLTAASIDANAGRDPLLSGREALEDKVAVYLEGADPRQPYVSPRFADLHGLPPLLVQAGGVEVLLDDASGLADAASAAGVDVEFEVWDRMIHVFQSFHPAFPETIEAVDSISSFLGRHMPM